MKSDSDFYSQIANLVKPEYFEYDIHSNIFKTVQKYFNDYRKLPTDDFIVQEVKSVKSSRENISDYCDELQYINSLDTSWHMGRTHCINQNYSSHPDYSRPQTTNQ